VIAYAELDTLFDEYSLGQALGEVEQLSWFASHVGGLERAGETSSGSPAGPTTSAGGAPRTSWSAAAPGRCCATRRRRSACDRRRCSTTRAGCGRSSCSRGCSASGGRRGGPTPLLAVVAPLLFGYMFGDVGQGFVLVLLGVFLQRRFEAARLAIAGGVSAWSSGSCSAAWFSVEGVIPPSGCTRCTTR